MTFDTIIGIDPGAAGGIAYIHNGIVKAIKMPKDINDILHLIAYLKEISNPIVFIERLTIRPDDITVQGAKANMGKMFRIQKMMQSFEHLKALMEVSDIPYCLVTPMKWQSALNLRIKGEEKADRKCRLKDVAAHCFPTIKTTLWNADALLIMQFGCQAVECEAKWIKEHVCERKKSLFE